jgi:hypothetical protein
VTNEEKKVTRAKKERNRILKAIPVFSRCTNDKISGEQNEKTTADRNGRRKF